MADQTVLPAPGARVLIRDAEWLVRRVDRTAGGDLALLVVGISELVRDKEATFLTGLEKAVDVLDPVDTNLVPGTSSAYRASLLYMEGKLRQTTPTDNNLTIGHRAAMDLVPYQLDQRVGQRHDDLRRPTLSTGHCGTPETDPCRLT